jgi:hypothetical protein
MVPKKWLKVLGIGLALVALMSAAAGCIGSNANSAFNTVGTNLKGPASEKSVP